MYAKVSNHEHSKAFKSRYFQTMLIFFKYTNIILFSFNNWTCFHKPEYHYNVWKNVIFEFGAASKLGIKLMIFLCTFKFFSLLQKKYIVFLKLSRLCNEHIVMNSLTISNWIIITTYTNSIMHGCCVSSPTDTVTEDWANV